MSLNNNSSYNYDDVKSLFPNGYKSILEIYLEEINNRMTLESKKIDLIRLRVHERIRELLILRLKIMSKEKDLIKRTFIFLSLPGNYNLATKSLYKAVDEIWFLAGDNSTDFNFYSKRLILGSVYTIVMMHFINNNNLAETIDLLDRQLKHISKIPKIKNKISSVSKIFPYIMKLKDNLSSVKQ